MVVGMSSETAALVAVASADKVGSAGTARLLCALEEEGTASPSTVLPLAMGLGSASWITAAERWEGTRGRGTC